MFKTRITAAALVLLSTSAAFAASRITTTSLTLSSPQIQPGATVALAATVAGNAPTGTVKFYEGLTLLGTADLVNGTATFQTSSFVAPGNHSLLGAYQGDAANDPSSGAATINVLAPPGIITIQPSHVAAGAATTPIWIRGTNFQPGSNVTVNGEFVVPRYESPALIRAVVDASYLTTPRSLSIVVRGDGTASNPDTAPATFTVDPPPATTPLSLAVGSSAAVASHVTPHGSTIWLVHAQLSDGTLRNEFFSTYRLDDTDGDGVVTLGAGNLATGMAEFPPGTSIIVLDAATGAYRWSGASYAFLPLDLIQGMRDGAAVRLQMPPGYFQLLWVRPGVGAWFLSLNGFAMSVTPELFQPYGTTAPVPSTFGTDDRIFSMNNTGSITAERIGDYLPAIDPATPSFILDEASVAEGNSGTSPLTFSVRLTSASQSTLSVGYRVQLGTATSSDVSTAIGSVTFQPGDLVKTFSVPVNGDVLNEPDETVLATLSAGDAPILVGSALGIIRNDDPAPSISIADASFLEGSPHTASSPALIVTLSAPRGVTTTGYVQYTHGTTDANDLFSSTSSFLIGEGQTTTTVATTIIGDAADEEDEVFYADVYAYDGLPRAHGRATVTILDDDPAPDLSVAPVVVRESTGADRTIDLPVDLTGDSQRPMSVDYDVVGDTATGADFVAAHGTLNIVPPNSISPTHNTIPITIRGDSVPEPVENLRVVLSNAANVHVVTPSATISIADDDRSGPYAAAVLADQPWVWYRLDDSSGTVAKDSSGNNRDAVYDAAGSHRLNVAGALGTPEPAASFEGSSVRLLRSSEPAWSEATVEAWLRFDRATNYYPVNVMSTNFVQLALSTNATNNVLVYPNAGGPAFVAPAVSVQQWHHVVLSLRSGASVLYVDGAAVSSSPYTFSPLAAIGSVQFGGSGVTFDEVAIYPRAFSAADVAHHYRLRQDLWTRADFDRNFSNDLVLRNNSTGANALWLMNGTSYASTVDLPYLPPDFRIEGVADFDGDGQPDLLLRNYTNGNNALWLMNGVTVKTIVNLPWLPVSSDFRFEGTADVNGDGWPDILIRNYTNGNNAVWLMNGVTFSSVANLPALPDVNYRMAGGGDFNNDGKADIVWRNQSTGANAVWLMDGTSLLSIANLPALPNSAYRFNGIADYDGDYKPDIVLRNYTTGADAIWLLDGVALKSIVNLPTLPNTQYQIAGPR